MKGVATKPALELRPSRWRPFVAVRTHRPGFAAELAGWLGSGVDVVNLDHHRGHGAGVLKRALRDCSVLVYEGPKHAAPVWVAQTAAFTVVLPQGVAIEPHNIAKVIREFLATQPTPAP